MSFLKTLGKILSVGEEVAGVFFPVLRPFLGSGKTAEVVTTGVNDFTQIASVITGVEAAFQTPGSSADKLAAAVPQVASIVKTSEALIGHTVYNNDEFVAGITDLVNSFVRILNSYSDKDVKSAGGQAIDFSKSAEPATPTPIKVVEMPAPTPEPTPAPEPTPTPTTSPTPHPLALS